MSNTCESPKVIIRQETKELGISRNTKVLGRRRIHITAFSGKESSLTFSPEYKLSGFYKSEELNSLLKNIENNSVCTNLSTIMSDSNFLIACWVNIKSKARAATPALNRDTLDGVEIEWFETTSNSFRNGNFSFKPARRFYIPKPSNKLRPLNIPSPKDKIVQEGMRLLLDIIFKPTLKYSSHGFRDNRGCYTALNNIIIKFGGSKWFIEGDVTQQPPSMNHSILIHLIKEKIKDQAFMDLVWKYLRTIYKETPRSTQLINLNVVQGENLSTILSNIYMHSFDVWMEDYLIPSFTKGKYRKKNPEYLKLYRSIKDSRFRKANPSPKVPNLAMLPIKPSEPDLSHTEASIKGPKIVLAKCNLRPILWNELNYKRIKYIRYADDFLVGVIGSKEECIELRHKMREFLENELKMLLNIDKTKIMNSSKERALFLGYHIQMTQFRKTPVRYSKEGKFIRVTPRPLLNGPIDRIVNRLQERGFVNKYNNPTRNGKFIALNLIDLVNHYRSIERGILNYYGLANNYGRVATRVHYLLKYSCALTIASKMKLKTLKRVFSKYGRDLNIIDGYGKITTNYPTVSYKRPLKISLGKGLNQPL